MRADSHRARLCADGDPCVLQALTAALNTNSCTGYVASQARDVTVQKYTYLSELGLFSQSTKLKLHLQIGPYVFSFFACEGMAVSGLLLLVTPLVQPKVRVHALQACPAARVHCLSECAPSAVCIVRCCSVTLSWTRFVRRMRFVVPVLRTKLHKRREHAEPSDMQHSRRLHDEPSARLARPRRRTSRAHVPLKH